MNLRCAAAICLLASSGLPALAGELTVTITDAHSAPVADAVVTVAVSLVTQPKPERELAGVVSGVPNPDAPPPGPKPPWWQSPALLGGGALAITLVLSIIFL